MSLKELRTAKRAAISAFLLFHLVAITFWALPLNSPLIGVVRDTVRPYILWAGLFQGWNMFAPEPMKVNGYVEALITYNDGEIHKWKFPRMEELGYTQRYFKERYRKFANEYVRMDSFAAIRPDVARRIARLNNHDPSNPPAVVLLVWYSSQIAPPGPDGSYRSTPLRANVLFTYFVKPGDLE